MQSLGFLRLVKNAFSGLNRVGVMPIDKLFYYGGDSPLETQRDRVFYIAPFYVRVTLS